MDLMDKLTILADSAKYDAACTSSGADRSGVQGGLGNTMMAGCCHSFAADGRCISLLKVLFTNHCEYDCRYCVNRKSNDVPRAAFTPEELAELTIQFYRRNYIEGLFLSSGVIKSPDHTMELMARALELLRYKHNFWGYIHAKAIPGASPGMIERLGLVADRLSVNIELPSENSLSRLAPDKTRRAVLAPMGHIHNLRTGGRDLLTLGASSLPSAALPALRKAKSPLKFVSAGQATQMIIGASPESDFQILRLADALYGRYKLKRVFYSAYVPAVEDTLLPSVDTKPPLLREHRLYQADWLLRFYGFAVDEILNDATPNFNPYMDPKCNWAINNLHMFPVDVNRAEREMLLRVPGIGPTSANRIVMARRTGTLGLSELKRIGVVLKRAQFFIEAKGHRMKLDRETTVRALIDPGVFSFGKEQLSLFGAGGKLALPGESDVKTLNEAVEEATACLAAGI